MAYSVLFLFLSLTVSKTAAQDCTTQQPGGSGIPDLQQVKTIPYCIIDDCTIKNSITGQQLDIAYTIDSLLIVIPNGNQTSMTIAKTEEQIPCITEAERTFQFLAPTVIIAAIVIVSGYIIFVHLVLEERWTSFGILLMLYNGAIIFRTLSAFVLLLSHTYVTVESQIICYAIQFAFMQGGMVSETFAICALAHIAAIMYYSDKLRSDIPVKKLFRYYITYASSTIALFSFFIINYDLSTGRYRDVILTSEMHCTPLLSKYDTVNISWTNIAINKMFQVALFATFLVYFYKHKKSATEVAAARKKINDMLVKIAIVMGATIGLYQLMWLITIIFGLQYILGVVGILFLFIQQCIIMVIMTFTKMKQCCCKKLK